MRLCPHNWRLFPLQGGQQRDYRDNLFRFLKLSNKNMIVCELVFVELFIFGIASKQNDPHFGLRGTEWKDMDLSCMTFGQNSDPDKITYPLAVQTCQMAVQESGR